MPPVWSGRHVLGPARSKAVGRMPVRVGAVSHTTTVADPVRQIIDLANAVVASRALHVIAELGVADTIGPDEEASAATIAERCGCDAGALHRVRRLLEAHGIFRSRARRLVAHGRRTGATRRPPAVGSRRRPDDRSTMHLGGADRAGGVAGQRPARPVPERRGRALRLLRAAPRAARRLHRGDDRAGARRRRHDRLLPYHAVADGAGFELTEVRPVAGPYSAIIARRR